MFFAVLLNFYDSGILNAREHHRNEFVVNKFIKSVQIRFFLNKKCYKKALLSIIINHRLQSTCKVIDNNSIQFHKWDKVFKNVTSEFTTLMNHSRISYSRIIHAEPCLEKKKVSGWKKHSFTGAKSCLA